MDPELPRPPAVSRWVLWVRTDQLRQTGMDYWEGSHSGIISAPQAWRGYRQIRLVCEAPAGRQHSTG